VESVSIKNRYPVYIFWSMVIPLLLWYGIPGMDMFLRMVLFAVGFTIIDTIITKIKK
jgi:hypothetical protein